MYPGGNLDMVPKYRYYLVKISANRGNAAIASGDKTEADGGLNHRYR